MQQTTCGETHKNEVYSKETIDRFIEKQNKSINRFIKKNCIYSEKSLISDPVLNYLNDIPSNEIDLTLKNLILSEYSSCEKAYPFLGDYFITRFFNLDLKSKNKKSFIYRKSYENKLLEGLRDKNVINLSKWILNNISLEYNIIIEKSDEKDIYIDVIDDFVFDLKYDFDFYKNNKNLCVKDYNFVIIDGFLETVSEIHHLMFNANKTKEPYVIFCHGISEEVKYNILKNNKEGRTQVLPVSIDYNEETLNVLNDLAVLHNDLVVSSKLGQTISQAVSKDLKKAKSITFLENKLLIKSATSKTNIISHRRFLKRRIEDANKKGDVNTDILSKRLKSFSLKSAKIFLPKQLNCNKTFMRDLDYFLRTISSLSKDMIITNTISKENYMVPTHMIKNVEKRVNSLQNILYNIEKIIA